MLFDMEGLQLGLAWSTLPQSLGLPIFRRSPPTPRRALNRQPTENSEDSDVLIPVFDSDKRKLSLLVAILSLSVTLSGGGLILVPSVFEVCGITWATTLLAVVAFLTERSLILLCLCARRTGVRTMADLAKASLGKYAAIVMSGALFLFLFFILVAEMVFLQEIWTPLVNLFVPNANQNLILLVLVGLTAPAVVWRELTSLRKIGYLWSFLTVVVCLTLVYLVVAGSVGSLPSAPDNSEDSSTKRIPIVQCISYVVMVLCGSINTLQMQSSLRSPTRQRVSMVATGAVAISFTVTYIVGLVGRIVFDGINQRNPAMDGSTYAALVAAGGFDLMVLCTFPYVFSPCRQHLLEFLDKAWLEHDQNACQPCRDMCPEVCEQCCDEDPDERTCMTFPSVSSWSTGSRSRDIVVGVANEDTPLLPPIVEEQIRRCNIQNNMVVHYGSTAVLAVIGYGMATQIQDISTAWSFVGSTVALLLSYAFPSLCYLHIQERDPWDRSNREVRIVFSWITIFLCLGICVAQVAQTFYPAMIAMVAQIVQISQLSHYYFVSS